MSKVVPIHRLAAKAKIKELEVEEGMYSKNRFDWSLVWTIAYLLWVTIQNKCDISSVSALTEI